MENFSINNFDRILYLQFAAYESVERFDAGDESLIKKGVVWTKTFTGDAFHKLVVLFAQTVASVAPATWQIADSVKDTPDDQGNWESFFANAGQILAPEGLENFFQD